MNKSIDEATLNIVKDGFEEQKGIYVLSLFVMDDDIFGIYVNNPIDSLSFTQTPLTNMHTDIDGHDIFMFELGLLLHLIYKNGSMQMYNILTQPSALSMGDNKKSNIYQKILDLCIDNPPLKLSSFHLIKWIDKLNDGDLNMSIDDLLTMVEIFITVHPLDVDVSDKSSESIMKNNLNDVKQELKNQNFEKIAEAIIDEIDKLFIELQIDLYMTDNK